MVAGVQIVWLRMWPGKEVVDPLKVKMLVNGLSWTGFNSQTVSDISTASASRANPIEPEKVFVEPTEGKKTSEDMPSEGKRRVIGIKFGETAWLSRIWPSKLLKT
ncbi:hypothetical protein R6Q59_011493 [Mikania micrantha]